MMMTPPAREPALPAVDSAAALRDLMGLLALPALWAGRDEETILQLMTDAVASIVPVAAIFAQVHLPPAQAQVSLLRFGGHPIAPAVPETWQGFTDACLGIGQIERSAVVSSPAGPLAVVRFFLTAGARAESIWFGFAGAAFPTATQRAFLHAAVALCSTGLNTARIDYDRASANRSKDEFLAMLGHELRNPLAPLAATLALIRLKGVGHLAREHAVMERQVAHLTRLVDDLLDVTRITRGKIDLRLEAFDVKGVVLEAVESIAPLVAEMGHRLTANLPGLNAAVHGDADRIRQVLVNLLVNAAKYTPRGGSITVEAVQDAGTVSVSVGDDGIGIDAALLPRVFDLFEQGATTIDRSRGGLGIGLAIVKRLVGLHAGTVTARSAGPGRGATFTVTLPLLQSAAAPAAVQLIDIGAPPTETRRILVVDDNADALEALDALLTFYGYEVLAAHDPAEALEKAKAFNPHAFILDIGLPGMDGYQLATELRRMGGMAAQAAHFIALTGYGQEADKARSLAAGFHRHLVKPVEIDDLLSAIRTHQAVAAGVTAPPLH